MSGNVESARAIIQSKSMGIGFVLTLFFGPLGLFYASILGGIIMVVLSLIVAVFTFGFGLIVTQIICIIWAMIAINNHNNKLLSDIEKAENS